ncbi:MAG: thioredoxin family protein [Candidatus Pacebacteria bacterium]|nr:thioredoxin family protein [Candidatus Paceibacterota bacterium]
MFKKAILTLIIFLFLGTLLFPSLSIAKEPQLEVDFFYSKTCPHCAVEKDFLDKIKNKYPDVKFNYYIFEENIELLNDFYKKYNVPQSDWGAVPDTFIGEDYFIGFDNENNIGSQIESSIIRQTEKSKPTSSSNTLQKRINLPIIGEINLKNYSLPALAVILGVLDGFNVCSLGALVLILGLVLALKSRKRILILGGAFILTTSIVYGFLIVLWYKLFSAITPYMKIMQIIISILAFGGGIYFLRQFLRSRKTGPTCEIETGQKIGSKFSRRLKESLEKSENIFIILGIVLLFAFLITIVEFPCSAAVPLLFAGILADSALSSLQYLFYISIFVFFYMLDELIVFLIAFFTLRIWISSNKIVKWVSLLEAIILFLISFYYLFGL